MVTRRQAGLLATSTLVVLVAFFVGERLMASGAAAPNHVIVSTQVTRTINRSGTLTAILADQTFDAAPGEASTITVTDGSGKVLWIGRVQSVSSTSVLPARLYEAFPKAVSFGGPLTVTLSCSGTCGRAVVYGTVA